MSGRFQPEHGADSACPICQGAGVRMGGDEYQDCPKCKGAGTVPCAGFHGDNAWGPCQSCGERLEAHQMIAP